MKASNQGFQIEIDEQINESTNNLFLIIIELMSVIHI